MTTLGEQKYTFETEWYDQQADIIRPYRVIYFPQLKSVEMYDTLKNRIFLKKQQIPSIALDDFFVGAQVNILSRVLKVCDYGDVHTRKHFETARQRTFAMIKPDCYAQMGQIINAIQNNGLAINKLKMSRFKSNTAAQFYAEHKDKPFFPNLQSFITSDVVVGMELVGNNACQEWRGMIGPTNTQTARAEAPQCLRAQFGTDGTKNAVHGSDSLGSYKRENNYWFGGEEPSQRPMQTTAVLDNCTLCLIKPHIQREGKTGQVIEAILQAGFEISAMELFNLSRPIVEEFYCVYKNVLPEYLPIVENLSGGPVIALEVRQTNAVASFRTLCGPHDPEIARHLRPDTLR